jgi:hypothetical protein
LITHRGVLRPPLSVSAAGCSRSGSRWGRSPGRYPAAGLSCSSLRRALAAARRAGIPIRNSTPSRIRQRLRRPASQPRRRWQRRRRPRCPPPRPRTTRLRKVRAREGLPLVGTSETGARAFRPRRPGGKRTPHRRGPPPRPARPRPRGGAGQAARPAPAHPEAPPLGQGSPRGPRVYYTSPSVSIARKEEGSSTCGACDSGTWPFLHRTCFLSF